MEGSKPKLVDEVRKVMRRQHYSLRTETTYWEWIRRFILYHGKRHRGRGYALMAELLYGSVIKQRA